MIFKNTNYGDLSGQHYEGIIDARKMNLTSLEGAPKSTSGGFDCSYNKLTSLEGSPESIGEKF